MVRGGGVKLYGCVLGGDKMTYEKLKEKLLAALKIEGRKERADEHTDEIVLLLKAVNKQIPETAKYEQIYFDTYAYKCPSCGAMVHWSEQLYCRCCGQKIDWSSTAVQDGSR